MAQQVVDVVLLAGAAAAAVAGDLGLTSADGPWLAVASVRGVPAGAAWPDLAGSVALRLFAGPGAGPVEAAVEHRLRDVVRPLTREVGRLPV